MIRYKVRISQIADTGDYSSDIIIKLDGREFASCAEGENLVIEGCYQRYKETGMLDNEGFPECEDTSLILSPDDLLNLYRILLWWQEIGEEPKELSE